MKRPTQAGTFSSAIIRLTPAALLLVGCISQQADQTAIQLRRCREENTKLQADIQDLQTELLARQKQIRTLQGLGEKRLENLFHVTGVKLGKYTAGADLDKTPGQDGIRVYLTPIDRDGHAIKAAGAVKIQLFDLAAKENLVAEHDFPVEKISEQWAGGFMTYHYCFDCRWPAPPEHDEITVRVEFIDYLTGKTFTVQMVCKVKLPVSTTATAPATQPGK
ncbi:MAG: hypothetical protein SVV80_00450 [Planctomycetota bacterium]|nr:hypothetical protein [Planctomycetota bacterium]